MHRLILVVLLLIMPAALFTETDHYLSVEALGSGGFGSVNYEAVMLRQHGFDAGLRAGFSLMPIDANNGVVLIFPVMAKGGWGTDWHHIEVGIGQTFSVTTKGNWFLMMPAELAYRLEPPEHRYFIRIGYTPIISYLLDFQVQHWGGISFGLRLNGWGGEL